MLPQPCLFVGWLRTQLTASQNLETSPRDPSLTPEKLYALRRSLLETQKLHTALVAEKQRNDALITRLKALLQPPMKRENSSTSPAEDAPAPFAFLTHTPAAQRLGVQSLPSTATAAQTPAAQTQHDTRPAPLSTHTTFSTSQLPYLRQLLAALSPHLPTTALPSTTPSTPGATDVAKASRERKAYVESQSRRILERRGVDTREGVGGEGGRVRGEEVRALEGLVGELGRGGVKGRKNNEDGGGDGDVTVDENGTGEEEGDAMDTS
jgi:kinetochore protein Mis12/MTW1